MQINATHVFEKNNDAINLKCYFVRKSNKNEYDFFKKKKGEYVKVFSSIVDEEKYKIEESENEGIIFLTDINELKEFGQEHIQRRYRYIINTGSSRSAKTWSLNQKICLDSLSETNKTTMVLRDIAKDCRDMVEKDFKSFIRDPMNRIGELERGEITNEEFGYFISRENLSSKFRIHGTDHTYTSRTNSVITFSGADSGARVHGKGQSKLWINEPYNFTKEIFDQLDQRTSEYVLIDWNPREKHWIEDLAKLDRSIVIHSTYRENPFCPEGQAAKIDSYEPTAINIKNGTADERMWKIYGLGVQAEMPNKIYSGWEEIQKIEFDRLPYESYYGIDWGQISPTAIVEVKYDGDRTFYLNECLYKSETEMIHELKKNYGEDWSEKLKSKGTGIISNYFDSIGITQEDYIICDNNKPDKIIELRREGFNAISASKKKGSVHSGISFIQRAKIYYTKSSSNLIKEYNSYEWQIKKNVNIEEPIKKDDHLLDPGRYVIAFLRDYLNIKL